MAGPAVMLASPTKGPGESVIATLMKSGDWWFENKFDGVRAVVHRDRSGRVQITNRRQLDITKRYPDIVDRLQDISFKGIIDGEIICTDIQGRPNFELVHRRDAQSSLSAIRRLAVQLPATFVPFDVLEVDGKDQRRRTLLQRRTVLQSVFGDASGAYSVSDRNGEAMWSVVKAWQLEGLIAKRATSLYIPGRSNSWLKIKATRHVSVLVSGTVQRTNGNADSIGAVEMSLWDPEARALVSVGRVGSGLTERHAATIRTLLAEGRPVVVDVEYLEVSSAGQLRMPTFRGVRTDIPPEDCTVATLE